MVVFWQKKNAKKFAYIKKKQYFCGGIKKSIGFYILPIRFNSQLLTIKKLTIMTVNLKNGNTLEVEQIRFCSLSSGVKIGLFRNLDKRATFSGNYVLIVKRGRDFLHQFNFLTLVTSIQSYLDYVCRYA